MSKITRFIQKYIFIILVILISIPTFYKMLSSGIYSMQDFHLFRLYEFDKCIKVFQIPCRWSPDAGLGYGEPLFNFYGQFVYAIGESLHLTGISFVSSIKILFIFSLVGSGVAMFLLSRKLWGNNYGALLSSALYLYAPYRAVDVWVRGALPESFAFILFPLIILNIEKKNLFYFSVLTFILIITHNLSFVMFLPLLIFWIIFKKWWRGFWGFVISGLLSAFYILPVLFESKFVNLASTTLGYFDFRAHFITLKQIFLDMSWGYGGSTWGPVDNLNLSVGIIQWVVPVIILLLLFFQRKIGKNMQFLVLFILGLIYLLLTHNKTAFVWEIIPFMKYIQFPWRFLGLAVFCFSLAAGVLFNIIKNKLFSVIVFALSMCYVLNIAYWFSPDIWYNVSDDYFLTGAEWDRQRTASIGDFWPQFGHEIPDKPSDGKYINYFPGWESLQPMQNGLISTEGSTFKDTPIRKLGNIISLLSLGFIIWKRKHI